MKIITIGEMLVEIMRKEEGVSLEQPADFIGPFPSGAPAIFIDAVAKLGHSSTIIGGIGNDDFGNCLKKRLRNDGVDLSGVQVTQKLSTGVAFVSYSSDGSRKFLYHMGNSAAGLIDKHKLDTDLFKGSDMLHINGSTLAMNEDMRKACYKAVEWAQNKQIKISFDPNLRTELLGVDKTRKIFSPLMNSCHVFIPGSDEFKDITGYSSIDKGAQSMLDEQIELIAVKKGKNGSKIYTKNKNIETNSFSVQEVDPTGAGDAFSAAIDTGWLEKMNLKDLGLFANAYGALSVKEKGPMEGLVTREKVERFIDNHV